MAPLTESTEKPLFPSTMVPAVQETWERTAIILGFQTEATKDTKKRFPPEKDEPLIVYNHRIEMIRKHEAALRQGRACTQNARSHGLSARVFSLLPGESPEAYETCVHDALTRYEPRDTMEFAQVVSIVNYGWLLERLQAISFDLMCEGMDKGTREADAFAFSSEDLTLLARYESHLVRCLDKTIKRLKELKGEGAKPEEKNTKRNRPRATAETKESDSKPADLQPTVVTPEEEKYETKQTQAPTAEPVSATSQSLDIAIPSRPIEPKSPPLPKTRRDLVRSMIKNYSQT